MSPDAPAPEPASPAVQSRDVRCAYSESLPSVLRQLGGSVLISTYRTGHLIVLSAAQGQLRLAFHAFERPMGVALRPGWLALGTRTQLWFLSSAPDIAAKLEPRGRYDACYLARTSHFTGDIHCHELAWVSSAAGGEGERPELWIVNTLFSCLCTVHALYSFTPRWRPPFVSALAPEDRCHLNGFAVAGGKARYVTAMAQTDRAHGWREAAIDSGCVIDVPSGQTICRGLMMPHSPRIFGEGLLVLQSGLGQLIRVDPASGRWESIAALDGYVRGLAIHESLAIVGLSKLRASAALRGVPIAAQPERLKCGLAFVDLRTAQIVGHFDFLSGIDELFDVQILPGITWPLISGPFADRDGGPPLWTVPPSR